jgi:hypothetical protein
MINFGPLQFQRFFSFKYFGLFFISFLLCHKLQAAQDAMVSSERAVIYSDQAMSSPIGFISYGKKITIGEIPRNKSQVYPIIVSGKVAYIRAADVTTQKESMSSVKLTAERFKQNANPAPRSKLVPSYFYYDSQINLNHKNGQVSDKDSMTWHGLGLKGEVLVSKAIDFQIISQYLQSTMKDETYHAVEFGFGGAYRFIDWRRFLARLEAQILAVPFSSYALKNKFRMNGYGYSAGAGLNVGFLLGKSWGLELSGGLYYMKLMGFNVPSPYTSISPSFMGKRIGVGLNFNF